MTPLATYATQHENGEFSPVKTMVKYFKENGYIDEETYLIKEPTSKQIYYMAGFFEGMGLNPKTVAHTIRGYLMPSSKCFRGKVR